MKLITSQLINGIYIPLFDLGTVYTNPSRNQSFSKTFFKLEKLENADFAF